MFGSERREVNNIVDIVAILQRIKSHVKNYLNTEIKPKVPNSETNFDFVLGLMTIYLDKLSAAVSKKNRLEEAKQINLFFEKLTLLNVIRELISKIKEGQPDYIVRVINGVSNYIFVDENLFKTDVQEPSVTVSAASLVDQFPDHKPVAVTDPNEDSKDVSKSTNAVQSYDVSVRNYEILSSKQISDAITGWITTGKSPNPNGQKVTEWDTRFFSKSLEGAFVAKTFISSFSPVSLSHLYDVGKVWGKQRGTVEIILPRLLYDQEKYTSRIQIINSIGGKVLVSIDLVTANRLPDGQSVKDHPRVDHRALYHNFAVGLILEKDKLMPVLLSLLQKPSILCEVLDAMFPELSSDFILPDNFVLNLSNSSLQLNGIGYVDAEVNFQNRRASIRTVKIPANGQTQPFLGDVAYIDSNTGKVVRVNEGLVEKSDFDTIKKRVQILID